MHVLQHSSQIAINVRDPIETGIAKRELDEGILYQVLRARAMIVCKTQSPSKQLGVPLSEQLFLRGSDSALLEHLRFLLSFPSSQERSGHLLTDLLNVIQVLFICVLGDLNLRWKNKILIRR